MKRVTKRQCEPYLPRRRRPSHAHHPRRLRRGLGVRRRRRRHAGRWPRRRRRLLSRHRWGRRLQRARQNAALDGSTPGARGSARRLPPVWFLASGVWSVVVVVVGEAHDGNEREGGGPAKSRPL